MPLLCVKGSTGLHGNGCSSPTSGEVLLPLATTSQTQSACSLSALASAEILWCTREAPSKAFSRDRRSMMAFQLRNWRARAADFADALLPTTPVVQPPHDPEGFTVRLFWDTLGSF
mmetsp:Transcript_86805/g.202001  ORF Transcript_86805/g.202001 Transcript_86805/m.202001 type:complete len:116 (-) Transcript_86805:148-495(-)